MPGYRITFQLKERRTEPRAVFSLLISTPGELVGITGELVGFGAGCGAAC